MKVLSPTSIAPPFANYSHGLALPPNATIVKTSGQLGLAADGSVPSDAFGQAQVCFSNIQAILAEADMDAQNVFALMAYVTDRAHMQGYMAARDEFLGDLDPRPTSTLLIVGGFTRPEFVVEVEVWAAKPV